MLSSVHTLIKIEREGYMQFSKFNLTFSGKKISFQNIFLTHLHAVKTPELIRYSPRAPTGSALDVMFIRFNRHDK